MQRISNEILEVYINEFGAELEKINIKGVNILWQRHEFWNGQSPILFPICGALLDGYFIYNNDKYFLNRHGLARKMMFDVIETTQTKVVFSLEFNKETLEIYPFKFQLKVTYILEGKSVKVLFDIINLDTKPLYASIGIHPGFDILALEEYLGENIEVKFDNHHVQEIIFDGGLIGDKKDKQLADLMLDELLKDVYSVDTRCYQNVSELILKGKKNTMKIKNYLRYLALWRGVNEEAKFICIEGWDGLPDDKNTNHLLKEKDSILLIDGNESYSSSYIIEF